MPYEAALASKAVDVAVCVKQVPAPDEPAELEPPHYELRRDASLVLDEPDSYGVEMALRLCEQSGGGEVVVISVAPRDETGGLRSALALGAARALLVSDEAVAGSDALGTARVLAALARRAGAPLVVAATESSDGYTGTVPVQMAELLGYPAVTFAKHVETDGSQIFAQRQTSAGWEDIVCPLPAVLTVTAGAVQVRYPTLKGIMGAKSKPVEFLRLTDLGLDPGSVGRAGARQEVVSVEEAASRRGGRVVADDGHAHELILDVLQKRGVV
jgi:electron transfer flavoprotein beta subunit